jgi:glycosyltransferase involved in cell wall biosynthesis
MVIGLDVSRAVSSQPTGTEVYTIQLTKALIPLAAERGHQIRLYFNSAPADGLLPKADHLEFVNIPFPMLWTHLRLANELRQNPPDVFFTPAHVIPYSYRSPSVAAVHDLGFRYYPEAHTRWQMRYLNWSTHHNAQRGSRVISDSIHTKEDLVLIYEIPASKIDVIYPGLDPLIRQVTDNTELEAVQHKYGITPPYLLYIGTIQPRKNLSRLIEAFIQSGVGHQLVIAGKAGWRSRPILEKAFDNQSTATNNIVLPGFVAPKDKSALISGADALLYPSLYEGFGFPILEANACGTPVLCANTSSLPEIAGEAALLVDPLDTRGMSESIQKIVSDNDLRDRLTAQGFSNALRFTWQTTASHVMSTLESTASVVSS